MNTQILKSKKFRAAVLAALTALLTFGVSKFGWGLEVEETITLITALVTPFLIYIGAEGFSERGAKEAQEQAKADIAWKVRFDAEEKEKGKIL